MADEFKLEEIEENEDILVVEVPESEQETEELITDGNLSLQEIFEQDEYYICLVNQDKVETLTLEKATPEQTLQWAVQMMPHLGNEMNPRTKEATLRNLKDVNKKRTFWNNVVEFHMRMSYFSGKSIIRAKA